MVQPGKPLLASRSTCCVVHRVRDVSCHISALGKLNPIAGIGSKAGKWALLPGLTHPILTGDKTTGYITGTPTGNVLSTAISMPLLRRGLMAGILTASMHIQRAMLLVMKGTW